MEFILSYIRVTGLYKTTVHDSVSDEQPTIEYFFLSHLLFSPR